MSMINLSKYSILFFKHLIVLSFFSSVEANTNEDVTLDDILGLAYQASIEEPFVISSKAYVKSAEADLSASKRQRLPVFTASIKNALTIDRQISDRNALRKFEDEGLDLQVQMVQPIFTGLSIRADIDRSESNLRGSIVESNKRLGQTIIESTSAYMMYVRDTKLRDDVNIALKRSSELLELVKKRYNAGLTDLSLFAQMRIKYSEMQLLANTIESKFTNSRAVFLRFFSEELLPTHNPTEVINYDFLDFLGSSQSYDLALARANLDAAEAELLLSKGNRLPSIAVTVSGTLYDVDGSDEEEDEYDIKGGLQASWKFLDFGASRKKVQASQSKVRAAKYNINYQTRIDEVERLRLLSLISSLNKQLKEQYDVLEDINRQIMLMETQLTSSKFLGISLADLFYQKINIQSSIDTMEIDYVTGNLQLKLLSANLVSFIAQKDIIN